MSTEKQMICINCPVGCRMKVVLSGGQVCKVSGKQCRRGEEFVGEEAVAPKRDLTCLMRVEGKTKPFSVKTSAPVPKRLLFACAEEIFSHPVSQEKLPIHIGDVILADVSGSGADIISTQEVC